MILIAFKSIQIAPWIKIEKMFWNQLFSIALSVHDRFYIIVQFRVKQLIQLFPIFDLKYCDMKSKIINKNCQNQITKKTIKNHDYDSISVFSTALFFSSSTATACPASPVDWSPAISVLSSFVPRKAKLPIYRLREKGRKKGRERGNM